MNSCYDAIENIFNDRKSSIIIGLTGRTGSGCTTVANILAKKRIEELDLKPPKSYDYCNADERKQEIIYNYIKEKGNWESFCIIEGSAIILSFILEKGFSELLDYLRKNNENEQCRLDNLNEIEKELEEIKEIFNECKIHSLNDKEWEEKALKKQNSEYYEFYIEKLPKYKKMIQDILSKHICYPVCDGEGKAQLYTYLMQVWGNNIRATGDPYKIDFTQKNYCDVAKRINKVIKIVKKYKISKKDNSVRICIDALRNPYEAVYFRDHYKNFYLISISTEENYRKSRLSFLSKKEQEALEQTESPIEFNETEEQFYHQNVQGCVEISDIHIYNPDVENKKYYFLSEQIVKYITLIIHPGLITPTHIERCMQLAYNAKFNSGCLSRQVGAVITGDDFSVRAVGWNDVPKGQVSCNLRSVNGYCSNKDEETFSKFELCEADFDTSIKKIKEEVNGRNLGGRMMPYCFKDVYNGYKGTTNQVLTRSLHAEENAFLQISKYGGTGIKGGYLFTTASPCELCAKKAYQLGITNIYYIDPYPGISMKHILSFGKDGNPSMNLFYGAIGEAYISLYEPRMAYKDELELLTGINIKKVVKRDGETEENLPIVSDIRYNSMDITLIYNNNLDIKAVRKVDLEVTGEPINHIEKEMIWTGSEYKNSILIDNKDNYTLEDSTRSVSPYKYKVLFNKNIMKGEKVSYVIETNISDKNNEMQTFLSHTIKNPTEKLRLAVTVPKGIIKSIWMQEYRDSGREIKNGDEKNVKQEEKEDFITYYYIVKKPKLFYTYCIQWITQ